MYPNGEPVLNPADVKKEKEDATLFPSNHNSDKNKSATLVDSLPPSPMPADTHVNESMRADIDKIIGNTETEITSQNPAEKEIDLQENCSNLDSSVKISTSLFGAKRKKKLAKPVVIPETETVATRRGVTVEVEKENVSKPSTSSPFKTPMVKKQYSRKRDAKGCNY